MKTPDVPRDLEEVARRRGIRLDLDKVTYFINEEIVLPAGHRGMPGWRSSLFAAMARNESRVTQRFNLPPKQVFEIGMEIQV